MLRNKVGSALCVFGIVLVLAAWGCSRTASTESPAPAAHAPSQPPMAPADIAQDEEHGHEPGAHGGIMVSIGRDSYHAEAVFESGGTLRLFMLGNDETKVQEIEAQELSGFAKAVGAAESQAITLAPEPLPGDAEGMTSQFVAQLPTELAGQAVEVTIPSVRIAGERFRIGFASVSAAHDEDVMPDKTVDEEEQQLYLTPGGAYTESDIAANGGLTASERFAGFHAKHDLNPQTGDKICPITLTKANPQCAWVIGGQTYEFCCPPCVDEFVKLAKEQPEAVRAPESYVK